jgi:hypothetical protein
MINFPEHPVPQDNTKGAGSLIMEPPQNRL